jgi:Kef-type K+ transport system membrane component KefB
MLNKLCARVTSIVKQAAWRRSVLFLVFLVVVLIGMPFVQASETEPVMAIDVLNEMKAEQAIDAEHVVDVEHVVETEHAAEGGHGAEAALTFFWIAIILLFAKLSSLIEKFGQPAVLGELIMGVILGNLFLLGITFFETVKHNDIILFLSELGVVILLFQVGLESNINEMKKVGGKAFVVAIIGVVAPFILGTYVVGPLLMPGLSSNAYLFLGAALTATSVGITARVFQDLGKLHTKEAKIILGAAVIDDVMGLIILAVISAMVTLGAVSIGMVSWIIAKAVLFLVGAIVLGQVFAKQIGKSFAKINTGVAMKFTIVISFGLIFSFLAQKIGLAPIVGAFAAGLILDPVHFKYFKDHKMVEDVKEAVKEVRKDAKEKVNRVIATHSHRHIEDFIEPLGHFLIPIFFVMTGMSVNLETFKDPRIIMVSLLVTVVAFIGKYISSLFVGKGISKAIVGFGMVPRGEVGLIFATIGKSLGVVNDEVFSIIVIMVILTTLLTPPILNMLLKRQKSD